MKTAEKKQNGIVSSTSRKKTDAAGKAEILSRFQCGIIAKPNITMIPTFTTTIGPEILNNNFSPPEAIATSTAKITTL
ncbi:Uncharacterised protein [Salmonella enterica subsp. enterica serovar Bovismorbificans]|uniref:Uncharacterized protein n=1 Tax=Salmonella enterica subsp. enterica serovar Bovismorbificans TaxID=58097 RepID=A0A655DJJ2_SALET|nr:Uncharacterised protein [Salmonella enterica subsp. enterica serovar Bovismorbificans]